MQGQMNRASSVERKAKSVNFFLLLFLQYATIHCHGGGEKHFLYWREQGAFRQNVYGQVAAAGTLNLIYYRVLRTLNE